MRSASRLNVFVPASRLGSAERITEFCRYPRALFPVGIQEQCLVHLWTAVAQPNRTASKHTIRIWLWMAVPTPTHRSSTYAGAVNSFSEYCSGQALAAFLLSRAAGRWSRTITQSLSPNACDWGLALPRPFTGLTRSY